MSQLFMYKMSDFELEHHNLYNMYKTVGAFVEEKLFTKQLLFASAIAFINNSFTKSNDLHKSVSSLLWQTTMINFL